VINRFKEGERFTLPFKNLPMNNVDIPIKVKIVIPSPILKDKG
jgi:hypothetical protein